MLSRRQFVGALILAGVSSLGCKGEDPKKPPDPDALKREAEEYRRNAAKERGIKP